MIKLFEKKGQPGVLCDAEGKVLTPADIKRLEESSPLAEFNRLAEGTGVKPDADKELIDAWQAYGLSPEAARIAAAVQSETPKTADDVDWANVFGA
ncbi:MAG: hypothetical protein HY010_15480 [Acidobacteria bacterium]|nr:hypothetical protein [Acidobacteriota bacterium]